MQFLINLFSFKLRRPQLSDEEIILEQRKEQICAHFKQCRKRYNSVDSLIEDSPEDAMILFEHLLLDMLNTALLLSKNREVSDLTNAESEIRKVQDNSLSNSFIRILEFYHRWRDLPCRSVSGKVISNLYRLTNSFFILMEHSYQALKKNEFNTKLDEYRKRLKYQMIIFFLIILPVGAFLIFGAYLFLSTPYKWTKSYKRTKQNMREIAEIAYQTKKLKKKALFDITGSRCSDCDCRGLEDLREIDDKSPCAKKWYVAIKNIYNAVTVNSGVPNRFLRDTWNSIYLLDENENEFADNPCKNDTLLSAGQDGKRGTDDDIEVQIKNAFCN